MLKEVAKVEKAKEFFILIFKFQIIKEVIGQIRK